jgi:hypothetical protein
MPSARVGLGAPTWLRQGEEGEREEGGGDVLEGYVRVSAVGRLWSLRIGAEPLQQTTYVGVPHTRFQPIPALRTCRLGIGAAQRLLQVPKVSHSAHPQEISLGQAGQDEAR